MGRFDMSGIMADAWHVFNNMFVSVAPMTAALVGITLFSLALTAVIVLVRRSAN